MPKIMLVNGDNVRVERDVQSGVSVHDCEHIAMPDGFSAPTIALLKGAPVLRKDDGWKNTLLVGDEILIFIELPLGGRSGSAMAVQVVAMVAAMAATWYLGGTGGALVASGMSVGAANFTAGMVGMGIMLAGSLTANAITSQGLLSAESAEASSPTYSVNASSNMARLNQPEAEVFGRIKMVPDYVAQPYTEYDANSEWGYFIYGLGRGSYNVETIMYGDTKFWENGQYLQSGYTTEQGVPYSQIHDANIKAKNVYFGPFRAISEDDQTKTITVHIEFPNGFGTVAKYSSGDDNALISAEVQDTFSCEIQCAKLGSDGNVAGEWHGTKAFSKTFCSENYFEYDIKFVAPKYDEYAIRIKNTTGTTSRNPNVILHAVSSTGITARVEYVEAGNEVTLFPTNIYTSSEVSGLVIPAPNAENRPPDLNIGPYVAVPADVKTSLIKIDYAYTSGLGQMKTNGGIAELEVQFRVEAQLIDVNGNASGDFFTLGVVSDKGKTTSAVRKTRQFKVPLGRYRVRMRRISPTNLDNKNLDTLTWTGLRSVIPGTVTFPQAVMAVKIMATNALSQSGGSRFSVIETRKLPVYDLSNKTWSEPVATRTWAAALCSVCKSEWGGRMNDRQLDLETIWTINQSLTAKGWFFDACIDGAMSMWNVIKEMCQCVLVVPRMTGTVLSAVEDKSGRPVRFELNPRNIMRGTFSVTYNTWTSNSPDCVIVEYIDKDQGFASRDVECSLSSSESTEPVTFNWIGITNREHAFRVGTAYAARNRHRRISVTCQVEGLGRIINVGDVVSVVHPRFSNTGGGVVTGFDSGQLEIKVSYDFKPSDIDATYCSLVRPNGSVWGPVRIESISDDTIRFSSQDFSSVVYQSGTSPFNWMQTGDNKLTATQFALHSSRDFQRRMLVQSVTVDDLWHYTVTLVNDAEEAYGYQNLPVPAWGYK